MQPEEPKMVLQLLATHEEVHSRRFVNSFAFHDLSPVIREKFDAEIERNPNEILRPDYSDIDKTMHLMLMTIHWSLKIFNNYRYVINIVSDRPSDCLDKTDYTKSYLAENATIFDKMRESGELLQSSHWDYMKQFILSPVLSIVEMEQAAYTWVRIAYQCCTIFDKLEALYEEKQSL